ncbi:MAG: lysophospholipid acyltransferase family protein [bacterium]
MKKLGLILVSLVLWPILLLTFGSCLCFYTALLIFFSPLRLQWLVQKMCRLILLTAGQRLIITNQHPDIKQGPYLYLFNHGSLLDAIILGATLEGLFTVVAAKEYFSWPVWGWMMRLYNVVPIDRKKYQDAMISMKAVENKIRNGYSFGGSPEGTRTHDGHLQPFKKGLFHVAINTKTPIVPVVITGAYEALNRKSWLIHPGTIKVCFVCKTFVVKNSKQAKQRLLIDPREYTSMTVDQLLNKVRKAMLSILFL